MNIGEKDVSDPPFPNRPAQPDRTGPDGNSTFLLFRMGNQTWGISLSGVRETLFPLESSRIPGNPDIAEGAINLHGEMYLLLKTPLLLGASSADLPPPERRDEERTIFLSPIPVTGGEMKIAFRVDRILGIFPGRTVNLRPPREDHIPAEISFPALIFGLSSPDGDPSEISVLDVSAVGNTVLRSFRRRDSRPHSNLF